VRQQLAYIALEAVKIPLLVVLGATLIARRGAVTVNAPPRGHPGRSEVDPTRSYERTTPFTQRTRIPYHYGLVASGRVADTHPRWGGWSVLATAGNRLPT
jgi:hypothetical protein